MRAMSPPLLPRSHDVGRDQFDVLREYVLEAKKDIFEDSDVPLMDADM